MKFTFLSDSGHGWLKVPHALLADLGIAAKISCFSYSRGDFAYLEEDGDFSTFQAAMDAAGKTFVIRESRPAKDSRVRTYQPYYPRLTNGHADGSRHFFETAKEI